MMNGMKLGSSQQKQIKNSFAFENQFLGYDENDDQSQDEADDSEQLKSQENYIDKYHSSLPENSKVSSPGKKSGEGKQIRSLSSQMQQLSVSILQMKQKYNDLDMQQIMFKKRDLKKQQQVKQFLYQKRKQKRRLEKKMQKLRQMQAKKLQESIILQKQNKKNVIKSRIDSQVSKMQKQKQLREIQKQKKMQQDKKAQQLLQKIHQKQKKKFHLRKQQEDKKRKLIKQQKNRDMLMKRKQIYKPLDLQQLEEHEKKHREMIQQLDLVKKQKKEQQYRKILQENQKINKVYRGQTYQYVQQELEDKKLKKQEPYQKQKKMKNYQQYVRENFIPKTHQVNNKSAELDRNANASSLSHRQVKRYRYLQGVAYGQVLENRPLAKSQAQQRKIGNNYMHFMKSLPKRKKVEQPPEFSTNQLQMVNKRLNSIVKVKKVSNPLYQRKGRRSLDVKISQKPTREQLKMVIDQLKMKDKQAKMHEKVMQYENSTVNRSDKSKQINSQIIDNIQRKLNLLSKL